MQYHRQLDLKLRIEYLNKKGSNNSSRSACTMIVTSVALKGMERIAATISDIKSDRFRLSVSLDRNIHADTVFY